MSETTAHIPKWLGAGEEPALVELIDDPIAELLRQGDGIGTAEVWCAVRVACQGLDDARRAA